MIDWYGFAQQTRFLAFDEAHPEPELRLIVQDQKRRTYPANDLLLGLVHEPHRKRVLVTGRPGSGKSYLLSKLHYELALDLEHEIELANADSTEENSGFQPISSTLIPILVRLNAFEARQTYTEERRTIARIIEQQMSGVGYTGSVFDLFRSPAKFVVLIDDLDETLTSGTSENLREVRSFVDNALVYPNVQVIMAGRLVAALRFANEFRTYTVQPVDDAELRLLFEQTIDDPDRLMAYLTKWDGLKAFVATPYFANEAAGYWQDMSDEDFSLGRLLYSLIDNGLIERQMKTENRDRVRTILRERVNLVEGLAFHSIRDGGKITDDMMKSIVVGHEDVDLEEWLFLMEFVYREGSMLIWRNKWMHAYFAAHYLSRQEVAANHAERVSMLHSFFPDDSTNLTPATLPIVMVLLQDLTGEDYSTDVPEVFENLESRFSERERRMLTQEFEREVAEYVKAKHGFPSAQVSFRPQYVGDGEIDVFAAKLDGNKHIVWIVECKLRFPPYPKSINPSHVTQLKEYGNRVCIVEEAYARQNNRVFAFSAILATNGQDRSETAIELARQNGIEIWDFVIPPRRLTARIDLTKCDVKRIH